jgi:hypothetical protein
MVDGILGGLGSFAGGVGDFFTGGGKYADPQNINPRFGVPEADVRQAGLGALGNVGALLLAAGQSPDRGQRAQFLGQLGGAVSGMNTDLYKSSQTRLMTAQQQQAMREMDENRALSAWAQNPENLKSVGLTPQQFRVVGTAGLKSIVQTTAAAAAKLTPAQRALAEAAGRGGQPAPPPDAQQPETPPQAAPTPPIEGMTPSMMAALSPEARRAVETYQTAINDPRVQSDPNLMKSLLENIDRLVPGLKESQIQGAKRREALIADKPRAGIQVEMSEQQTSLADRLVDQALKKLESSKRAPFYQPPIAGTVGGRLPGFYEPSTDLQADLDSIRSIIGAEKIKEMKAQSVTGATGYGQLTVKELERIEASLSSLDQRQSIGQLQANLREVRQAFDRYKQSVRRGYKEAYGEDYKPPESGGPQRITSQEQFNSLKSGEEFIDPNGQLRRKP